MTMAERKLPLDETDLTQMKEALKDLDDADADIKLAEQAGINMDAQKTLSRETRTQITKIKQTFFPNR